MLVLPEQVRQDVAQRMAASGDLARRKAASPTFLYRRPIHQDEIRGASTPSGISPPCIIRSVRRAPMPAIHMRRQRIPVRSPERPCTMHLQPRARSSRVGSPAAGLPTGRPAPRPRCIGARAKHGLPHRTSTGVSGGPTQAWETEFKLSTARLGRSARQTPIDIAKRGAPFAPAIFGQRGRGVLTAVADMVHDGRENQEGFGYPRGNGRLQRSETTGTEQERHLQCFYWGGRL